MPELRPESITAIRDNREQLEYDLSPMNQEEGTLQAGDYSVKGLTDYIALERKSLPDFVACCGPERDRFTRELQRMKAYPFRAVVIEADWGQLERGEYRSQINPKSVCHSIISWQTRYCLPFALVGSRESGERYAREFLYRSALRVWERGEAFRRELGE